jgi:membrane-associated phospholipid phosphatase
MISPARLERNELQARARDSDRTLLKLPASRSARWAIAFALTALSVAVSYEWLDRPIAYFAHARLRSDEPFFVHFTWIPDWFAPLAVLAFIVVGLRALAGRPLSRSEAVVLLCALSLVIASAIKNELKLMFGRTWPETWVRDNPSLIRDGVYGFNPFHGGAGYESFPSGHTTAVLAVMSVLWICYPKFRTLYALVAVVVVIGLIGADFHFLSDCIAGALLGASTGWIVMVFWESSGQRAPTARGCAPHRRRQPLHCSHR